MNTKKVIDIPEDELRRHYYDEHLSMYAIAEMYNVCVTTILGRMKKFGMERRGIHDYPITEKQREHGRKIGKAKKGTHLSEETKQKLSEAKKTHRMGHRKIRSTDGYVAIYYPDYPTSSKEGYVMEHIYVMEQHLGRPIKRGVECVHHINGDKQDNRLENLQLMDFKEHSRLHTTERHKTQRLFGKEGEQQ